MKNGNYDNMFAENVENVKQNEDVNVEWRSVMESNLRQSVLPGDKGIWENTEEIGNCDYHIREDATITYYSKASMEYVEMTGCEFNDWMMEKYGVQDVTYRLNEPDFSPFEDEYLTHSTLEKMSSHRDGVDGNYAMAERDAANRLGVDVCEIRKYMMENDLTWHECGDGHTVQAIPTSINSVFSHTGGVAIEQTKEIMGNALRDKYGSMKLERTSYEAELTKEFLEERKRDLQEWYNSYRE